MNKTKFKRLVLFYSNLGSSFTEISFIQKKTEKIILRKKDATIIYFAKIRITRPKLAQEA